MGTKFYEKPVVFIRGLIQSEIDASVQEFREDVGPPITIGRLISTGWQFEPDYKGACR
jgi:hypothetical protein